MTRIKKSSDMKKFSVILTEKIFAKIIPKYIYSKFIIMTVKNYNKSNRINTVILSFPMFAKKFLKTLRLIRNKFFSKILTV